MRAVKDKMWPALAPSERLRTAVLMGGTVTLDQAFTADLLAEIARLKRYQGQHDKVLVSVRAAGAELDQALIVLNRAAARHRSAMRTLGIAILFWLAVTIALIGGWL